MVAAWSAASTTFLVMLFTPSAHALMLQRSESKAEEQVRAAAVGQGAGAVEEPDDVDALERQIAKIQASTDPHFLIQFASAKNWVEAENECISQGGHLASITNQAENDIVHGLCMPSGSGFCWIGGRKPDNDLSSGAFYWVDGTQDTTYTNKDGNHQFVNVPDQPYLGMRRTTGQWQFEALHHTYTAAVCELAASSQYHYVGLGYCNPHPDHTGLGSSGNTAAECYAACLAHAQQHSKICTGFDTRGGCLGYFGTHVQSAANVDGYGDCYAVNENSDTATPSRTPTQAYTDREA